MVRNAGGECIFNIRRKQNGHWLGGEPEGSGRSGRLFLEDGFSPSKLSTWKFELVDEKHYAIKNVESGLYLDGRDSTYEGQDGAPQLTNRRPSTIGKGLYLLWNLEALFTRDNSREGKDNREFYYL